MNEKQEELEKECSLCTDEYKKKYHCPIYNQHTESLLIKIACQVEHARRRNKGIS